MIPKIDAHHHCWQYDIQRHAWIDDSMKVIQRDFFPDDLQPLLEQHGVVGTVLIQADQTIEENLFLLSLADKFPFIKGIVGWVDLQAPDLEAQLEKWAQLPHMKGFRHVAQAEPNDFLSRPAIIKGIGTLTQFGFTYDILIKPPQMEAAITLVKALPEQRFVVDHIAKPYIAAGLLEPWKQNMQELASFENVYCKLSGMVTEADWGNWKDQHLMPFMEAVLEAFGAKRLMFGTDWPVCLIAASYDKVVQSAYTFIRSCSEEEQQSFWYGTASTFYGLD